MAKNVRELDTPFRPGEKVLTVRNVVDVDEGTRGRVQLANGLGDWRRYWIRFDDGRVRGQVSHQDLVRPGQLAEWRQRQEEREAEALRSEEPAAEVAAGDGAGGGGDGGVASQIPAAILERSKAAKARLLG
ncbi:MAG: hypothetical protein ACFCVK_21595 [Acidimicrobiales bacterium]